MTRDELVEKLTELSAAGSLKFIEAAALYAQVHNLTCAQALEALWSDFIEVTRKAAVYYDTVSLGEVPMRPN